KIDYLLGRHISPELRAREFATIRRDDVTALLDKIEDEHSPHQADKVFTIVRSIANWYASRHSDYNSPLVKGMTRAKGKGNGRDRKLDDDEIRAVWAAASDDKATGVLKIFDALVKMLLLTMQRLDKVVTMRWDDIDADGVWTVPIEPGEKENIGRVQLPKV